MQRRILVPPTLAGTALDELKNWLAITTSIDDATLTGLIRASLEMCEGFTGQMPLETTCEEVLPACADWQALGTRPVQAISGVEAVQTDGNRVPFASGNYEIDLEADGKALVRVLRPGSASRVAVRLTAGLAADWNGLPESLRHGVLRMAAHQYRERDGGDSNPAPPATIAALWRPWRQLRLT